MSPRSTLKDCQKFAKLKEGKCLSDNYINAHIKIEWECKEGHQWLANFNSIKNGRWCRICSINNKKLSIEDCKKFAKEKRGKCLSETYINSQLKLKWECEKEHHWESSFSNVKTGRWCPYCSNRVKLSIKHCQDFAKIKNGKCLDEIYINSHTKMKWECGKGHQWMTRFDNIKGGSWCPKCLKISVIDCQNFAKAKKGRCLTKECINNHTKMKWECKEGHRWEALFSSIKNGVWCPFCSGRHVSIETCKEYAELNFGKCLSKCYNGIFYKMEWECKEGHQWRASFNNVKRGNWCRKCHIESLKLSIEECKEFAKLKGGKCLSANYINSNTNMKWECKEGHQWYAKFTYIKRGHWCSDCQKCPKCLLWRTNGVLCDYCNPNSSIKIKIYQKSKEWDIVHYLRDNLYKEEFIHNKSVGSDCTKNDRDNTNGHLFPDIRFDKVFYQLIIEIDEYQHRGADYSCDKRRMYDIIAKLGQPCIFIRYNPDGKHSSKDALLEKIIEYLNVEMDEINSIVDDHGFKSEYMFYKKLN